MIHCFIYIVNKTIDKICVAYIEKISYRTCKKVRDFLISGCGIFPHTNIFVAGLEVPIAGIPQSRTLARTLDTPPSENQKSVSGRLKSVSDQWRHWLETDFNRLETDFMAHLLVQPTVRSPLKRLVCNKNAKFSRARYYYFPSMCVPYYRYRHRRQKPMFVCVLVCTICNFIKH